jgi:hypothetical protein
MATPKKASVTNGKPPKASEELIKFLGHALVDEDFRSQLVNDAEELATRHGLSTQDIAALKTISPADLQAAAGRLCGHVDMHAGVGGYVTGHFNAQMPPSDPGRPRSNANARSVDR